MESALHFLLIILIKKKTFYKNRENVIMLQSTTNIKA